MPERKGGRGVKSEINHLYRYACKLFREGLIGESESLSRLLVKLAFKYKLGSYAFELVCRKCMTPLIPGVTLTYRVKRRGGKSYILKRCIRCGYTRKKIYKHKGVVKRAAEKS